MAESGMTGTPATGSVALAVEDGRLADEILGRFEAGERQRIAVLDDPTTLIDAPDSVSAEVVIVSLNVLRAVAKFHLEALAEFCRTHQVVLLIRSNEFLDSTAYLEFVNGVIFADATLHRVKDILALSQTGYSILPSAAVMDIVTDRLRCDAIARLSPIELAILDQIRLAKTNRAIARSLELTEANVKTKVRAILKSLKFQNRTEAAVFAARQNETLRRIIKERTADQGSPSLEQALEQERAEERRQPH